MSPVESRSGGEDEPTYLERMIGEIVGYIELFSDDDNIFSRHLDGLGPGVRAVALQTYETELEVLGELISPSDAEIAELHAGFESVRERLIIRPDRVDTDEPVS